MLRGERATCGFENRSWWTTGCDDDDNYIKFTYEYDWFKGEGQRFIAAADQTRQDL
jgi:hypothetical protein